MKETVCSIAGLSYKLEYRKMTGDDGLTVFEGILFQQQPLIFSLTVSNDGVTNFSPLQTPPLTQDAVKNAIETEEKINFSSYC